MTLRRRYELWATGVVLLSALMFFVAINSIVLGVAGLMLLALPAILRRNDAGDGAILPRWLLTAITIGIAGWAALQASADREQLVGAIGRLLVWLQIARLFDKRSAMHSGSLLVMSLFTVLAAILTSTSLLVGVLLVAYMPAALWTVLMHQIVSGHIRAADPQQLGGMPAGATRGLRRLMTVFGSIGLVMAGGVYFVMPRGLGSDLLGEWPGARSGAASVGFTDEVLLSRSGQLDGSAEAVLDVSVSDLEGRNLGAADRAILLRGAALDEYDTQARRWRRSADTRRSVDRFEGGSGVVMLTSEEIDPLGATVQRVTVRNKQTPYLFAAWRPVAIELDHNAEVVVGEADRVLQTRREGRVSYTVVSNSGRGASGIDATPLEPIDLSPRVRERVDAVLAEAGLSRDPEAVVTPQDREIAQALMRDLWRTCVYSTELQSSPPDVDPVEYFLFVRRSGHCEQFASALAVMLRGLGVSARVVTGFRAQDYNQYAGHYTVRQRDAHAWVEVLVEPDHWFPMDPSPPSDLFANLQQDTSLLARLRKMWEAAEHLWVTRVISFDESARQGALARLGIDLGSLLPDRHHDFSLATLLRRAVRAVAVGAIAFGATIALGYFLVHSRALFALLRSWFVRIGKRRGGRATSAAIDASYAELLRRLAKAGLRKPDWMPPGLFARTLETHDAQLASIAGQFADLYYEDRFAAAHDTSADISRAEALVRRVETRLAELASRRTKATNE